MKTILTSFFFLIIFAGYGQTIKINPSKSPEENEKTLAILADSVFQGNGTRYLKDSVTYEDIFIQNFLLTLKSPQSFHYLFPLLIKNPAAFNPWGINVIYSDDSLLRVFNWFSPGSGTWHNFPAIFQAKNKSGGVICSYPGATYKEGTLASTAYHAFYRVKMASRQLYLSIGHGQGSSRLPFEIVETFEVKNDSITAINLLPDSAGMSSEIFVDRQSTVYKDSTQTIPSATYDPEKQELVVPEITGSYKLQDDVKWTGKFTRYKFNGKEFVKE